ncbi:transcriptional regulator with XRE-family HTH domain [Haloactinomyces albus]|uniref:Transcriptional regulator with XRE-family HTH domain n=1 Tax=Haloactinomyces albus TaxID=1352928 RepID=A0AAE3ZBP2_9ACTN|nr:transcriptional regulator with XRE-family HTH domain [Haloactinomyces albus]
MARLQLGQLLRELREAAGRAREDTAIKLECKTPKISKIETGRATIGPGDARLLIELYDADAQTAETVLQLARQARKRAPVRVPDWAQRFVAMESISSAIRIYEAELIPGLLQTEEYTRAVTKAFDPERDTAEVERLVEVRAERQALLNSEAPPHLWTVINEAVIRRPVGGAEIMHKQLLRLRELADLPRVTLQVLPFTAGAHAAMGSSFHLLQMRDPSEAKVIYTEDLASSDYLDGPAQIERYSLVFDRLQVAALGETETAAMLDRAIRDGT